MSALANEVGAINVSQGFPDYHIDPVLSKYLSDATTSGWNQYAPMPGVPVLRQGVATKYKLAHGCDVNPDTEITITPGATAALFTAIAAAVQAGDEVIIFEPCYDSYAPSIRTLGAVVKSSPLLPTSYTPDWDHVRSIITEKTKLIIVNSPHNPCGSILSSADIDQLADIAERNNLLVLSDEVYELVTFDGYKHHSVLSHPLLCERSFVVTSFGKTFHITGWKIGACVACEELTRAFRAVHQYLSFCVNAPAQVALARYMDEPERYLSLNTFFEEKRNLFRSLIASTRWDVLPCRGSYFQLLGYTNISDESDVDFAKRITREHGIATIPLSPFFINSTSNDQRIVRVCFAKQTDTLVAAAERLASVC